jgi:hypothetical protein
MQCSSGGALRGPGRSQCYRDQQVRDPIHPSGWPGNWLVGRPRQALLASRGSAASPGVGYNPRSALQRVLAPHFDRSGSWARVRVQRSRAGGGHLLRVFLRKWPQALPGTTVRRQPAESRLEPSRAAEARWGLRRSGRSGWAGRRTNPESSQGCPSGHARSEWNGRASGFPPANGPLAIPDDTPRTDLRLVPGPDRPPPGQHPPPGVTPGALVRHLRDTTRTRTLAGQWRILSEIGAGTGGPGSSPPDFGSWAGCCAVTVKPNARTPDDGWTVGRLNG